MNLPENLRGDGPCQDCDTLDNIVWFTDSVFWNHVMGDGTEAPGVVCILCFVKRADEAGYRPTAWRLLPDWHWETIAEAQVRRGRG